MAGPVTDAIAWVVVGGFAAATLLGRRHRRAAQAIAAGTWLLFGVFWLLLTPHFAFVQKSFIEGVLSAVAVPACFLVGYLTWTRRPSLLVLARAVAIMGAVYLPFIAIPAIQERAIAMTAHLATQISSLLGYELTVAVGEAGYGNQLTHVAPDGDRRWVTVVLACTGIGSISVVAGLVMAVGAPIRKRLGIVAGLSALIYALNLLRVTFIALAYGRQWFHVYPDTVLTLFGSSTPRRVSYFVADRVIAQSLSLVVMIAVMLWLLRTLPELADVADEVGYVLTGRELELRRRLTPAPEPESEGATS